MSYQNDSFQFMHLDLKQVRNELLKTRGKRNQEHAKRIDQVMRGIAAYTHCDCGKLMNQCGCNH